MSGGSERSPRARIAVALLLAGAAVALLLAAAAPRDQRIVFEDEHQFLRGAANLARHGRLDFGGEMHLYLRPHSGRLLGLDFFIFNWTAEFLGLFTGALMGVEVTGTFEKPETTVSAKTRGRRLPKTSRTPSRLP